MIKVLYFLTFMAGIQPDIYEAYSELKYRFAVKKIEQGFV